MYLRSQAVWQKKLDEAITLLKKWGTYVAESTLKIIASKEVVIMPFSDFTLPDIDSALDWVSSKAKRLKLKKLVKHQKNKVIKELEVEFRGLCIENRIYIDSNLDPVKFAKTLTHEVNHYLNRDEPLPEGDAGVYQNELRAYISEKLVYGRPITKQYLKTLAEKVSQIYKVPLPEKITFPRGKYTVSRR
ncbi:hypothetical protein CC99x_004140 [Candidatus Berkiella cookevillensis]|uniref:IrrE N-terminal-like domain-containing protein n=1 Tax=Candidatus Berkiella cookevillensis TaxID=437022 RepID=A0A0Q9YCQ4_9GAMM|nr:hypothetical protein [Candidatus Berkiella cookevillensis]MCS5708088.1 hypothetical protein [Candidatus Berkiella cookevillensis]